MLLRPGQAEIARNREMGCRRNMALFRRILRLREDAGSLQGGVNPMAYGCPARLRFHSSQHPADGCIHNAALIVLLRSLPTYPSITLLPSSWMS